MGIDYGAISGYGKQISEEERNNLVDYLVEHGEEKRRDYVADDIQWYVDKVLKDSIVFIEQGGNYYVDDGIVYYAKIKGKTPQELIDNTPKALDIFKEMGLEIKQDDLEFYEVCCVW